jgi:hypothetical protein
VCPTGGAGYVILPGDQNSFTVTGQTTIVLNPAFSQSYPQTSYYNIRSGDNNNDYVDTAIYTTTLSPVGIVVIGNGNKLFYA